MLRFALISIVAASALAASAPRTAVGLPRASTTPLLNALELRGGGMVPADTYTKASAIIYAIYALQFFAIPEKFISDHFEGPVDAMHVFLARGSGLAIAGVAYAMYKFDVPLKLLVAYNAMVGLVYPWNAAYISKLPVKYPMHYLPEVLMAGLTVAGVLAL